MDPFTPKQCPPRTPNVLDFTQGSFSKDIAREALSLVPPMTNTSVVHDNACGTGAVTEAIVASSQKPGKLFATDLIPPFVASVEAKAHRNGWGFVKTATMDAMNLLGFESNFFTHSITNFCLQGLSDPSKGAKEIYRTVKPAAEGGVAIITTWATIVQGSAIQTASEATRGKGVALRIPWIKQKTTTEWLERHLKNAGFTSVEVIQQVGYTETEDLEKWCELMWAFLGIPSDGWTQKDETQWENAVKLIFELVQSNEDVELHEDGGARIRMLANIAIAKK
ncbi:S-adenosyl-L-methionine-dependent methyltransferase [Crepidotus variabilis]|uniref:S-adenosyl-L-methionine-dependent methyltransferase n=1 Tax=Crepidotus variabilis TaxID=179855 RepID=A0A9P6ED43_9AGAR|nr:S-adenosyl-L-methionine-dependent methyltransferase [Crepidotus variabilis]